MTDFPIGTVVDAIASDIDEILLTALRGHRITIPGTTPITGRIHAARTVLGGMIELVIDGQSYVVVDDTEVTFTVVRPLPQNPYLGFDGAHRATLPAVPTVDPIYVGAASLSATA